MSKADEYLSIAKKKEAKSKSFLNILFKNFDCDDIYDLYIKAANAFKLEKRYDGAIESYLHALKFSENRNIAQLYIDLANSYEKNNDIYNAIEFYKKAVEIFAENGIFNSAGRYEERMFEITNDVLYLNNAVKYYECAGMKLFMVKCLEKIITKSIDGDPNFIINNYEKMIELSGCDDISSKFRINKYIFHILIFTIIANDDIEYTKNKFEKYTEFEDSHECKLIKEIIHSIETNDIDYFTNSIYEYDNIRKLSKELTTCLLKIKNGKFDNFSIL